MCWTAIEMPMRRRSLNVRVSGSSRSANRRWIGTQPEVVGDEPLDKRRDPAQKPRSARSAALGGHPQRGLVASYRFFEVVNLAGTVSRPRPPGGGAGPASTRRNPRYMADESELMKELAAAAEPCCAAQ
jgi:hypothetical protein